MAKSTKMTIPAAARIMSATAKQNGGKVLPHSFSSRADSAAQRNGISRTNSTAKSPGSKR